MSNPEVQTDRIDERKWESCDSNTGSSNDAMQGHNGDIEDFADRNLAQVNTVSTYYSPFAGGLQPGLYRPGPVERRKIANPAPLGLCGFALTTFVLGCINMEVKGISQPNIFVASALAYGGLIQLLSGMWYVILSAVVLESDTNDDKGRWGLETRSEPPLYLRMVDSGSRWPSHLPQGVLISKVNLKKPTEGLPQCSTIPWEYFLWWVHAYVA